MINKIWSRGGGNKTIINALNILHEARKYALEKYKRPLFIGVDFINGIESATKEQLFASIKFAQSFQIPWDLAIHNLTLNEENELAIKLKKQI